MQQFARMCGAFVLRHKKLVLEVGERNLIELGKFAGWKSQLWHYKEFVRHSKCKNARYKVMKFVGGRDAVVNRNLFAMPTMKITVAFWMKATSGTPFSYSTKHVNDAITVTNPRKLQVYIMGRMIQTSVVANRGWTHIAVTWDALTSRLQVHKNGALAFSSGTKMAGVTGRKISAGGCAMIGQRGRKPCRGLIRTAALNGEITDVLVWRGSMGSKFSGGVRDVAKDNKPRFTLSSMIRALMKQPVPPQVISKVGKLSAPNPSKSLRWAITSRQYASQELGRKFPPMCNLVKHKRGKKVTGPGGYMHWGGSGDVHYHTFARCYYDDQSTGDWTALEVNKMYRKNYPLRVSFRTSPQRQRCSWCQNGAVSYIDGCAIKMGKSQASAGFGGFNFPNSQYKAYAAFNGKPMGNNRWYRDKNMRVRAYTSNRKNYGWGHGNFMAYLTRDRISLRCGKGSIRLRVPRKLQGKIGGLAGNGIRRREWVAGPNPKGGVSAGHQVNFKNFHGNCARRAQYPYPNSPYNGNRQSKPIVKWFNSWAVDGKKVPSAFYYLPGHSAGSFNRIAGKGIRPIKGVSKNRPKGAKAKAKKACRMFRNAPKALKKCVFDYMVLGKKAIKRNMRDRMAKRKNKRKKPTKRSVRDVSAWKSDAEWTTAPHWGCAHSFNKAVNMVRDFDSGEIPRFKKKMNKRKNKGKRKHPKPRKHHKRKRHTILTKLGHFACKDTRGHPAKLLCKKGCTKRQCGILAMGRKMKYFTIMVKPGKPSSQIGRCYSWKACGKGSVTHSYDAYSVSTAKKRKHVKAVGTRRCDRRWCKRMAKKYGVVDAKTWGRMKSKRLRRHWDKVRYCGKPGSRKARKQNNKAC
jgi:hypothetical protein